MDHNVRQIVRYRDPDRLYELALYLAIAAGALAILAALSRYW